MNKVVKSHTHMHVCTLMNSPGYQWVPIEVNASYVCVQMYYDFSQTAFMLTGPSNMIWWYNLCWALQFVHTA